MSDKRGSAFSGSIYLTNTDIKGAPTAITNRDHRYIGKEVAMGLFRDWLEDPSINEVRKRSKKKKRKKLQKKKSGLIGRRVVATVPMMGPVGLSYGVVHSVG